MKKTAFILILNIFSIPISFAASITCNHDPLVTYTIPLSGAINVGPDTPNGTVIFENKTAISTPPNYFCKADVKDSKLTDSQYFKIMSSPLPLATWSGGGVFNGKIYETNIPGIGVSFYGDYSKGNAIGPGDNILQWQGDRLFDTVGTIIPVTLPVRLSLIKIGDITPGALSGSTLPTLALNIKLSSTDSTINSGSELTWDVIYYNFSGSLNVQSRTCNVSDVNVNMGSVEISDIYKNKNSEWKKFNITMTNCPVFSGYYNSTRFITSYTNGTRQDPGALNNNISLLLTPNTETIDSQNGIFSLDKSNTSASGIGIQLAYGDGSSSEFANFITPKEYVMPIGSSGQFIIPMAARYTQTEDKITSGQANSSVTFLINYN